MPKGNQRPQRREESKPVMLRGVPKETMYKLRAAAAISRHPLQAYIRELFEKHIADLESKGLVL